jgi:hypothetical protein
MDDYPELAWFDLQLAFFEMYCPFGRPMLETHETVETRKT